MERSPIVGDERQERDNPAAAFAELATLLPELSKPDFDFGHWVPAERPAPAVVTMPYYAFSPQGLALIAAMPVLSDFNWSDWQRTAEGQAMLNDRSRLAEASADDLIKLTTTLLRGDHFTDGTLANAYASGLLRAIVERANELAEQEGPARPS